MQPDDQTDDGAGSDDPPLGGAADDRTPPATETLEVRISLDGDAAHAYERIVDSLERRHDREIGVEEHAERILRKYIADEYRKFILNGDPAAEVQPLGDE